LPGSEVSRGFIKIRAPPASSGVGDALRRLRPEGGILGKFLSTLATAFVTTALLGSGQAAAQTENPFKCEPGEKYVMNVMVSGVEYWFPVYEMFKQAGQQFGCETEYTGTPEYDVNKQIASFDQALAQNPAGILVHPMNSDPFVEPINRAIEQGTAVVTFAADSPNSNRISYITSDNIAEGTYAADAVAEDMGGRANMRCWRIPARITTTSASPPSLRAWKATGPIWNWSAAPRPTRTRPRPIRPC